MQQSTRNVNIYQKCIVVFYYVIRIYIGYHFLTIRKSKMIFPIQCYRELRIYVDLNKHKRISIKMNWNQQRWDILKQKMKDRKEKWAKTKTYYSNYDVWGEIYGYTLAEPYTKEGVDAAFKRLPEPLYKYLTTISREMFTGMYPCIINLSHYRGLVEIQDDGCVYKSSILVLDKIQPYEDSGDSDSDSYDCIYAENKEIENNLKHGQIIETGDIECNSHNVIDSLYVLFDDFLNSH